MRSLPRIVKLGFFVLIILLFGALFVPSSLNAQTCSGTFRCCLRRDLYGNCIVRSSVYNCSGNNSSQCNSINPNSTCSEEGPVDVNCSWGGCSTDADCGPNGQCIAGQCVFTPQCYTDADCQAGYVCQNSVCVPEGPPPPPPPPPRVTPTETPPPPPVFGNARPRYQIIQPYPFPCNEVAPGASEFNDFEFHSLRPYQASPCNLGYEDLALFCGNDLILTQPETILKNFFPSLTDWTYSWVISTVPGGYESQLIEPSPFENAVTGPACAWCQDGQCVSQGGSCDPSLLLCGSNEDCARDCVDNGDGTETCYFNIERVRDIAVDLEGAYLPIMGFTEPSVGSESRPDRVTNNYSQSETMDDSEKVNEYVSWYLNGVNGRAEYPQPNPNTEEGRSKIIDFSGPLKKLLSWASQVTIRRDEISGAGSVRHNQIVVNNSRMTNVSDQNLKYVPFSSTEDRLGQVELGSYSIQPALSSRFRILWSQITNQVPAVLFFAHMQESSELAQIFQSIFSYGGADLGAEAEPSIVSTSAFCDLRGIRSNPGDNLFAGELSATVTYGAQVECEFAIPDPDIPGNLCRRLTDFEADCVSDSLYCDTSYQNHDCQDGQQCGVGCSSPPTGQPCEGVPAVGPGDPFDGPFSCFPSAWGCTDIGEGGCPGGYSCADEDSCSQPYTQIPLVQECNNNVLISFRTNTETPLADDIWARLVANPISVFRRLFPQIEDEDGRPITRLWDMPGATSVIYQGEGVTVAGNPGTGRPANQAELYFPHIGGVHEYFLKCIQKTLRPEGFGEGCISGPEPLAGLTFGDCATPPPNGAISPGAGTCQEGTGFCSPGYLAPYFGSLAHEASIICNMESGGNPAALNCGCFLGTTVDYSVGLFQINLLAHCDAAMSYTWTPVSCSVNDQAQVDACLERFFDPEENAQYAANLRNGAGDWGPWAGTARPCGLY